MASSALLHFVLAASLLVFLLLSAVNAAQEPKSDSKTASTGSKKMNVVDWVRAGALVVGFVAAISAGRKTWFLADIVISGATGFAMFFFPAQMLGYQTVGTLDAIHLLYAQGIGAMRVGHAATMYYSRNTRDNSVQVSFFMSHTCGGFILLSSMLLDHFRAVGDKQHWSEQHLYFGILGNGLWVAGNLIQLIRSGQYGVGTANLADRTSRHLLLEVFLNVCYGVFIFAHPQFELQYINMKNFSPDGIHGHLVRAAGVLCLVRGLHAINAFSFPSLTDRRAVFLGTLVGCFMMMPTMVLYNWKYEIMSRDMNLLNVGMTLLVGGNAVAAFCFPEKSKKY